MRKDLASMMFVALLSVAVMRAEAGTDAPPTGWQLNRTLRTRLEVWSWFDPGTPAVGKQNNYAFLGQLFRGAATKQGKNTDAMIEIAVPVLFALPDDAIAAAPQGQLGMGGSYKAANGSQVASIFLKQAALTFKGFTAKGTNLRVGRFEFIEGVESLTQDPTLDWIKRERIAHRLIGNFGFTHIGRSVDGVHLTRNTKGANLTLVAARPTVGVFDLDGNKEIRDVDFIYAALTKKGSATSYDGRLFYILYNDDRGLAKVDNSGGASGMGDINISTFGGHYAQKMGKADLLIWGAVQSGDWGVHNHDASAWDVELGYQPPNVKCKPWFRVGTCRSSGDGSGTDGTHETFFQILPTPRIYARFPFYNMMNTEDNFAMVIVRPSDKTTVRADYHRLRLSESADRWYVGGGAFQQGTFGYVGRPSSGSRDLAKLIDVSVDYKATANTTFTVYYARAFGGGVVSSIYPAGRKADLFYVEVAYKF